ncbi:MAG TPA: repressor LexA [Clostridiaceae bacterium]|nr:repressor LexA [Clostridiaceae bacterium]
MSIHLSNLTSKQKKVYAVIETYIKTHGIPPTVREIGELVGEKTPGAVQGILNRLEQKGVIKRQVGMARSIQLVSQESMLYAEPKYIPQIKKITRRNIDDPLNIYNIIKYQPFPPSLLPGDNQYFMIKCPDISLEESGINQGDLLVVCMDCEINDSDIIIILFEDHVLLRYYYKGKTDGSIILKADTNLLDREEFNESEVHIVGKVIGKYEKF